MALLVLGEFREHLVGADNLIGLFQAQKRDRPRKSADEGTDPCYGFRIASLFDLSQCLLDERQLAGIRLLQGLQTGFDIPRRPEGDHRPVDPEESRLAVGIAHVAVEVPEGRDHLGPHLLEPAERIVNRGRLSVGFHL